jgi:hypothetical protein
VIVYQRLLMDRSCSVWLGVARARQHDDRAAHFTIGAA